MKKINLIGGGTGIYTLLTGLKHFNCELTSIVSMMDSGGSTGKLRDEFGILPVGDVRRSLLALSENREIMRKLFDYRFQNGGGLKDHSLGNLILTALSKISGSDVQAIEDACEILNIKGRILPITIDNSHLCAELETGQIIKGETHIDIPKHDSNLKIKKLFLEPSALAYSKAVEALKESDFIIIGPGDLYTSVIANLVVDKIPEAIKSSKAKKVYVCNLMTKQGETNNFSITDHLSEIIKYLGEDTIDYVIYNSQMPTEQQLEQYSSEKSKPVHIDNQNFSKFKAQFIGRPLTSSFSLVRHDADKVANIILNLD
ncbi:MAG: gluconeogenesis factor YvcK family protein [archaeon]